MGIGSTYIGPLIFVSLSIWIAYMTYTPNRNFKRNRREHAKTMTGSTKNVTSSIHYDLVVGILSARDHYQQRNAIRNTWMSIGDKKIKEMKIKVMFVVGDEACEIPEDDRVDEHSCDWWNHTEIHNDQEVPFYKEKNRGNINYDKRQYGSHRWSFRVQQPLILTKLGMHKDSLGDKVIVKLVDAASQSKIVDVIFTKEKPGTVLEGYRYKPVEQYFLPKGFEGTLTIENMNTASGEVETTSYDVEITNTNLGNSVHVLEANCDNFPAVHYRDSREWNSTKIPLVSFIYKAHEPQKLKSHIKEFKDRLSKHVNKLKEDNEKLENEIKQFKDIQLVNVKDVYRNIPLKTIKFFSALTKNSKSVKVDFVLKTDDDCYVDLEKIHTKLKHWQNKEKVWWGRFRHNWVVERFGKWGEPNYPAQLYPQFACGAGYVLSQDLVKWLHRNRDWLKLYQGEDVSQGVWLSAVGPQYIDDPMWRCENECVSDMYVMPDLQPNELHSYWSNRQKCGDPCGCD